MGDEGGPNGVTGGDATEEVLVPAEFVAVTVNVYETPLVRPVTVHEVAGAVAMQDLEPLLDVTVYELIDKPPVDDGADQETTDMPVVFAVVTEVAETPEGAPGGPLGVTADADEADAGPVPAEFVAVTVNVYATPLVRPVTVHEVAGEVALQLLNAGDETTK